MMNEESKILHDKYYPKGRFTSRKQAYIDYVNFCESENIKNIMDGMEFEDKLIAKCVLQSQYDPASKYSKKYYMVKK